MESGVGGMMANSIARNRIVAREILQYLIEHPNGKDTMEGILKYWLPKARVGREEVEIKEALNFLVSKGWMTEKKISSFEKIYGLNKEQLEDMEAFLGRES